MELLEMEEKPAAWVKKNIPTVVTWVLLVAGFAGGFAVLRSDVGMNTAWRVEHAKEYIQIANRVTILESHSIAAKINGQGDAISALKVAVERLSANIENLAKRVDELGRRMEKKGI